jgi:hypothetical protein
MFVAQEDPGESLSDCEKDTDEVVEEDSKITDEEEEDSFVVPDGYLSDNEVHSYIIEQMNYFCNISWKLYFTFGCLLTYIQESKYQLDLTKAQSGKFKPAFRYPIETCQHSIMYLASLSCNINLVPFVF